MEDTIEKKRIGISPLFSFFIAIIAIYFLIYLFLRINHDIVHTLSQDGQEQHAIFADMPMGHELYLTTLIREKNAENVENQLQRKIDFHQRKKRYLDIIFYPVIELEKICWKLFRT